MKIKNIIKGSKYHSKLYPSILETYSFEEYQLNQVFQNEDNYYFEIVEIKYDCIDKVYYYKLNNVGYYKKLNKGNLLLSEFNKEIYLVEDPKVIEKIYKEDNFI
jgi:hypothetical protein